MPSPPLVRAVHQACLPYQDVTRWNTQDRHESVRKVSMAWGRHAASQGQINIVGGLGSDSELRSFLSRLSRWEVDTAAVRASLIAELEDDPQNCDLVTPEYLAAEARIDMSKFAEVQQLLTSHPLIGAARTFLEMEAAAESGDPPLPTLLWPRRWSTGLTGRARAVAQTIRIDIDGSVVCRGSSQPLLVAEQQCHVAKCQRAAV